MTAPSPVPAPPVAASSAVRDSYGATARRLHWTIAALLACQFITAALLPDIRMDTRVDTTISVHFQLGLAILVVTAIRLLHRWRHPVRVANGAGPAWERALAAATHRFFYAILLVGPFLGWAAASAHSVPVRLLGVVELPALAPRKAPWALLAGDVHGWAMWTLLALVGVHAAAALYHHFVRRDDVLLRMLPGAATPPR